MLRTILLSLILLLSYPHQSAPQAAERNYEAVKKIEFQIKRSAEFLKAARKIVGKGASGEAEALVRLAEESAEEAMRSYDAGDYDSARKGFSDSIQTAVNAIILSRNAVDGSLTGSVLKEEAEIREARDRERKKTMVRKAAAEVEVFIRTAEKLLANSKKAPDHRLNTAKELFASSGDKSARGDHDGALLDINGAYKLVTSAIKEIKRSQGEIVTFPQKGLTDPKTLLAHELKKNDTYVFLASRMVNGGGENTEGLIKAAMAAREEARRSLDSGDSDKAIERLQTSTGLLIKAIKASGN